MLFFLPVSVKYIQCIIYSVRIVGISVISVIIIITVHIDIVIAIIVAVVITALFRTAGVFDLLPEYVPPDVPVLLPL